MKKSSSAKQTAVEIPEDLKKTLDTHLPNREAFDKLPPSHQREYIKWIEEAKTETTRQQRIAKTLAKVLEKK